MINETQTTAERAGFCQTCGKALNKDTVRVVGTAVYCEPCLAARLAGGIPYGSGAGRGYAPVNPSFASSSYGAVRRAVVSGIPNPVLAGFLGIIPGVGAMYNEQYAKGIVHLVIFAVLSSLSNANGVFGLMAFGWVCYMAIESYHTARARRDGTPLPNPFGFNDIGERMGFGRAWPGGVPPVPTEYRPASGSGATPAQDGGFEPVAGPAASQTPPEASWGAPTDQYGYPVTGAAPPSTAAWNDPRVTAQYGGQTGPDGGWSMPPYVPSTPPYVPSTPPYVPSTPPYVPSTPPYFQPAVLPVETRSRFPLGAVWLIVLGAIFLIGNTGLFYNVQAGALVGFALIGLSIWLFTRSMTLLGQPLLSDGSPGYGVRVFRALRGAVWVLLIGVLLVLDQFNLVHWHRSWPYFIILAGVMAILERSLSNAMTGSSYTYPPAVPAVPAVPVAESSGPLSGSEGGR